MSSLDILRRSTKRNKASHPLPGGKGEEDGAVEENKKSYRDSVRGASSMKGNATEEEEEDGDVSDDDVIEEGDGETWFGMGMMTEEKIEARRPWRNSLIIKLVG